MNLDIRTLIMIGAVGCALGAVALASLWRLHRHRFRGLGFWRAAFAVQALAMLFFALSGTIPTALTSFGGSALSIGSALLFCTGFEHFLEQKTNPIHRLILLLAFLTIHAIFTFVKPDPMARNINSAAAILIIFLQGIWLAMHHGARLPSSTRWIPIIFVGFCLISAAHILSYGMLPPTSVLLTEPGLLVLLLRTGYGGLVFASILLIFSMINEHLSLDHAAQERALRESENRYRQLVELSPEAIVVYQDGKIVFANSTAARLLKTDAPENLIGQPVLELVHPEDRGNAQRRIEGALATGKIAPLFAERLLCYDGTVIDVEVTTSRLEYRGQPALQTVARDITQRKRIEAELQRTQEQLEAQNLELRKLSGAIEQSASTILMTDSRGKIEYVNPAFTRITGYTTEDALGQNPRILKSDLHGPEVYRELWSTIRAGDTWQGEIINRKKDGTLYYEAATISPVKDRNDQITHYIAVKEDITERKRAEENLRESEEALRRYAEQLAAQNAELDAFAHTVAHDLKNPIGLIMGYVDLLQDDENPLPPAQREAALKVIAQTTRKLNTIIEELMLLSGLRKQTITPVPANVLNAASEAQQRLLDQIEQRGATLVIRADTPWPEALGYAPWIEEVWANYLSNALKYGGSSDSGVAPHVEIGWDWTGAEGEGISHPATLTPSPTIRFWVRDNGPGLSSEALSRLFVPFTRLDQVRIQGHGLGLSIVQRIIERLGGQVGVESRPGEGSTFYFVLPAAPGPIGSSAVIDTDAGNRENQQADLLAFTASDCCNN